MAGDIYRNSLNIENDECPTRDRNCGYGKGEQINNEFLSVKNKLLESFKALQNVIKTDSKLQEESLNFEFSWLLANQKPVLNHSEGKLTADELIRPDDVHKTRKKKRGERTRRKPPEFVDYNDVNVTGGVFISSTHVDEILSRDLENVFNGITFLNGKKVMEEDHNTNRLLINNIDQHLNLETIVSNIKNNYSKRILSDFHRKEKKRKRLKSLFAIKCGICGASFKYRKIYEKHCLTAHGIVNYEDIQGRSSQKDKQTKFKVPLPPIKAKLNSLGDVCGQEATLKGSTCAVKIVGNRTLWYNGSHGNKKTMFTNDKQCDIETCIKEKTSAPEASTEDPKSFLCPFCSAPFKTLITMGKHLVESHLKTCRLRETVSNFKCPFCYSGHNSNTKLQDHIVTMHSSILASNNKMNPELRSGVSCTQCHMVFSSNEQLTSHTLWKHSSKSEVHTCDVCEFVFGSRVRLQLHRRSHAITLFRPYKCVLCQRCFKTRTRIFRHLERSHQEVIPDSSETFNSLIELIPRHNGLNSLDTVNKQDGVRRSKRTRVNLQNCQEDHEELTTQEGNNQREISKMITEESDLSLDNLSTTNPLMEVIDNGVIAKTEQSTDELNNMDDTVTAETEQSTDVLNNLDDTSAVVKIEVDDTSLILVSDDIHCENRGSMIDTDMPDLSVKVNQDVELDTSIKVDHSSKPDNVTSSLITDVSSHSAENISVDHSNSTEGLKSIDEYDSNTITLPVDLSECDVDTKVLNDSYSVKENSHILYDTQNNTAKGLITSNGPFHENQPVGIKVDEFSSCEVESFIDSEDIKAAGFKVETLPGVSQSTDFSAVGNWNDNSCAKDSSGSCGDLRIDNNMADVTINLKTSSKSKTKITNKDRNRKSPRKRIKTTSTNVSHSFSTTLEPCANILTTTGYTQTLNPTIVPYSQAVAGSLPAGCVYESCQWCQRTNPHHIHTAVSCYIHNHILPYPVATGTNDGAVNEFPYTAAGGKSMTVNHTQNQLYNYNAPNNTVQSTPHVSALNMASVPGFAAHSTLPALLGNITSGNSVYCTTSSNTVYTSSAFQSSGDHYPTIKSHLNSNMEKPLPFKNMGDVVTKYSNVDAKTTTSTQPISSTDSSTPVKKRRRQGVAEKKHKCPYCDMAFTQTGVRKVHMRTHTGEKPYHCELCDRRFMDRSSFQKHQRTHTGAKPYECHLCGTKFTQSGNLRRHFRTVHPGQE